MKTGFAREIITPPRGLPLAGYFNPRPNRGVLDDLHVKVQLFQQGKVICGIVSFDLCALPREMIADIRKELRIHGIGFGDCLIFCNTHTHTGPYTGQLFGRNCSPAYTRTVVHKCVMAVERAWNEMSASIVRFGSVKGNPFAFNRRYYMRDGGVKTNPGKLNPDIVKPEGAVDREIGIMAITQDARTVGILVNIANHADTIGGDLVSADWPGQMEKTIQAAFGYEVPVVALIGCAGNINHFDVKTRRNQTCYAEAKRIGAGYAKIVLSRLDKLADLKDGELRVSRASATIPYRTLSAEQVALAETVLKEKNSDRNGDLKSEDLAKGDRAAQRFFADQLIRFGKSCSGKKRRFELLAFGFADELAIACLPGEPFTEIGMEIRARSPFPRTLVVSHAMGRCGYVPLKDCFARGGYETLPVAGGGSHEDTAEILVQCCLRVLGRSA